MAKNIWYRIRKTLGMLSHEEDRAESTDRVKNPIRAQMLHPNELSIVNWSDEIKTKGIVNIPDPIPKKEKLRPRSILEDWEVTQDSG